MKMFDFIRPASIDEAIAAWRPGAAWLGGGTNLVDLMKTGAAQPDRLIDLGRLPGLDRISGVEVGDRRAERGLKLGDDGVDARGGIGGFLR